MLIKFNSFSDGFHSFNENLDSSKYDLSEEFTGDLLIHIEMSKSQKGILLNCNVESEVKLFCDRCLAEYYETISVNFALSFIFGEQKEIDDENLYFISLNEDKIDISPDIRDYLILGLPSKKLCSEECKGICPECGINFNEKDCNCTKEVINPVWEKLQKLKNKE